MMLNILGNRRSGALTVIPMFKIVLLFTWITIGAAMQIQIISVCRIKYYSILAFKIILSGFLVVIDGIGKVALPY